MDDRPDLFKPILHDLTPEARRFHAACFAMTGLLANPNLTRARDISQARNCDAGNALLAPVVNIEKCAVQLADHLLAALSKPAE